MTEPGREHWGIDGGVVDEHVDRHTIVAQPAYEALQRQRVGDVHLLVSNRHRCVMVPRRGRRHVDADDSSTSRNESRCPALAQEPGAAGDERSPTFEPGPVGGHGASGLSSARSHARCSSAVIAGSSPRVASIVTRPSNSMSYNAASTGPNGTTPVP